MKEAKGQTKQNTKYHTTYVTNTNIFVPSGICDVFKSVLLVVTTELVSLGCSIGTDTGCAGCQWVEIIVWCEEHTQSGTSTAEW